MPCSSATVVDAGEFKVLAPLCRLDYSSLNGVGSVRRLFLQLEIYRGGNIVSGNLE